jgi:channel protein (hemolysin III family)
VFHFSFTDLSRNLDPNPFPPRTPLVEIDVLSIPGFTDPVSSLTHLVGAVLFACLAPFLVRKGRGDPWRTGSLGIFAFATVFLFSMSGTYHLLAKDTTGRAVLQRLDHGAIFILIAGTFTPLHAILFRGAWRWLPLLIVWSAAIAGVALKSVYFRNMEEWVGLLFYLAMGGFGVFTTMELWRRHGVRFIGLLLLGAAAYAVGGILEFLRWPVPMARVIGPHEVFHVMVLLGAALHWRFVYCFACGTIPPGTRVKRPPNPESARDINPAPVSVSR